MLTPSSADLKRRFTHIYKTNAFGGVDSVSGKGSSLDSTSAVRAALPGIHARYGIRSLLDAPCGDFHWMATVDLGAVQYIGADIVEPLITSNIVKHGRDFRCLNIVSDPLPPADLILCRDCLVHLTFADIAKALDNFRQSGAKYLLTTTFPGRQNSDLGKGLWRALNMEAAPFNLPAPLELINEGCTEGGGAFSDKSLGLWCLNG